MKSHPYAKLFPLITGKELEDLAADIDANGLNEAIVTYQGMILDGRNRFEACALIGKKPKYVAFGGSDKDALAYVLSANLHRRHLTESQRAMVGAELANMRLGYNQHKGGSANLQTLNPLISQAKAAEAVQVSERTVAAAVAVKNTGTPELVEAVKSGEVSVSAAAEVAKLSPSKQKAAVAKGAKGVADAAKKSRAARKTKTTAEPVSEPEVDEADKGTDEQTGPKKPYTKDDGIPDLPGVYRPRFMRTNAGHEVAVDALDNTMPDAVGDVFADTRLREILADCIEATEAVEAIYQRVQKLKDSPSYPWLNIPTMKDFIAAFRDAAVKFQDHIRGGIPYVVCPKCGGDRVGCKPCSLSGYWPKAEADLYPELFRKRGA